MSDGGSISPHLAASSPQGKGREGCLLIAASASFQHILNIVDAVATNDSTVLLEGESGTGKELLARRIHAHSPRAAGPFIPVNCPGVSETLFESQFCGHLRGSFTGATTDTLGVVRAADGGTLLLDEVGELPLHLQPKLLRMLQEREVTPVGASRPIAVNTRFIASTNRRLAKSIAEGTFRSDLYHRLNVVRIEVPPLRDRPEDIEPLVDYYIHYYARQYNMPVRQLGVQLRRLLREYPWPGNVRELCGYIERLYAAKLPPMPPSAAAWQDRYYSLPTPIEPPAERMPLAESPQLSYSLAEMEMRAIKQAMQMTGYNRSAAARLLDIHRSTLLRKIRRYGLDMPK